MLNIPILRDSFKGLVGIRQPFISNYAIFDAENIASESGLYLDDLPYFKASYLIDGALELGLTDAQINERLKQIFEGAVINVANQVFNENDFICSKLLYPFPQNKIDLENQLNGFTGYEIKTSKRDSNIFVIKDVRIELVSDTDRSIDVLLFKSGTKQAIETKTVNLVTGDNDFIEPLEWTVSNYDESSYYLGFNVVDGVRAYKREFENSNRPNEYADLHVYRVLSNGHNTNEIFNLEPLEFTSDNNGLNPTISIYNDWTNLAVRNKHLFARAIQLQTIIQIYHLFIASNRSNLEERYSKDIINRLTYLIKGTSGDGLKETGLETLFYNELKSIKLEIKRLKEDFGTDNGIKIGTFC